MTKAILGFNILCAALLALNACLLVDHKGSALNAIAHLDELNITNLEAHADMMAGCKR